MNGSIVLMPPSVSNEFSTTFTQTADASISAGSTLVVEVDDEDVSSNDPGFVCQADPLTAAQLRGRNLSCTNSGWQISFTIEPK